MPISEDPQIKRILESATELTRLERTMQIELEIKLYGAHEHHADVLEGALGVRSLEAVTDLDFNHAAAISWLFIYDIRRAGKGNVH